MGQADPTQRPASRLHGCGAPIAGALPQPSVAHERHRVVRPRHREAQRCRKRVRLPARSGRVPLW